jgi:hypothetical protein
MSKLTPEQRRKLEQTEPIAPTDTTAPIETSTLLAAARDRQERELADLETHVDLLAEEFSTRAAAIVEAGLRRSYQMSRQKIGAIDTSFFNAGELSPALSLPDGEKS